ncbi:UNVERIFIED_CONTAM: hypothetical protein LBW93_05935 [Wolbachia endosymbiont of Nasonia longicornis]
MPILQQNALVTIYLKAFLLTITSINTSYATKPSGGGGGGGADDGVLLLDKSLVSIFLPHY